MKENNELEERDIVIDRDMDVDWQDSRKICVYIETWFDVDKKFGIHIRDKDDTWLNLYAKYDPFQDTLTVTYEIAEWDSSSEFDYIPTEAEAKMIKEKITEKIQEEHHQTPQEFCMDLWDEEELELYRQGGM